ncbi:MAG: helicase-exonuclease AddAB subunit AddA [Candidatus Limivivens sp.]|nr:helicase-exonuclease AddAB subunit AddA [Candidatus Limivivens sp.]
MGMTWTPEQQAVIDLRERNILVSAAAGSGKTAVLVERIVGMLKDPVHPVDIDQLLVVTFTRAAAGEMRERIQKAVDALLEEEPGNEHLQRQQTLIGNARITTIDSFCNDILHNYFHLIGLDPDYRVADDGEQKMMKADVMEKLLEEKFAENTPEFRKFVDSYAPGRDDREVGDYILRLYEFSMSHPWPENWLNECRSAYDAGSEEEMFASPWALRMMDMIRKTLGDTADTLEEALGLCREPEGPWMYEDALERDLETVKALRGCRDYREMNEAFLGREAYARLSAKKDANVSDQKRELVKQLREQVKKSLDGLEKQFFGAPAKELYENMADCRETVNVLVDLALEFSRRYAEAKREKNLLDFPDMEHLALKILVDPGEGTPVPTQAARELAGCFEEIMIDEYQDSNQVQELILNSISGAGRGKKNLFMVGDVKQSIYRFRMARPELFMEKYQRYSLEDSQEQRIDLHKNFRSREEVLESANFLFRRIMTKKMGGVVYDDAAALYPGAEYPAALHGENCPEVLFLNLDEDPESFEESEETERELEARMVGTRILELVGRMGVQDKKTGQMRKARFGDCVILFRTVSGWAESFLKILGTMGIPAYTGTRTGYFSSTEIQTVLSFLKIIDNPRQDIAFAAVLTSPIGNFTSRELAVIKSRKKEGDFYTVCRSYLENGEDERLKAKLGGFFEMLEEFRGYVSYLPMHELLWKVFDRTGYADYAAAMPGGAQRAANLHMLEEKAAAYEETSYRGLYNFIRYIENLKKVEMDYGEAAIPGDEEDTVKLMSIHKSKGLEFPIVFVPGLQKNFNRQDIRSRLVLHPDLGIGCDYVDPTLRCRIPLLMKRLLQKRVDEDNLSEELRVLYVAMTRAKEKLILTGVLSNAEKRMLYWKHNAPVQDGELSYTALSGASSYLDWVMPVLLGCPDSPFRTEMVSMGDLVMEEAGEQINLEEAGQRLLAEDPEEGPDLEERKRLEKAFTAPYPYEAGIRIGAKLTVSELKKMGGPEEEPGEALYQEEMPLPWIPEFMKAPGEATGADRGTIYHRFLEKLDFGKAGEQAQIEAQIEALYSRGYLTEDEKKTLHARSIFRFVNSALGQRMQAAFCRGQLKREQQFVIGLPARSLRPDWDSEELVLVQGIIDAFFQEGEELVLVDYKTDYTEDRTGGQLWKKYAPQLFYYQKALEQLTGKQVKETVIYSFWLQKELRNP